ncbi:MAG: prepilin peptidase [Planctomycetes bacterium]|nr:prepilin peptidase [Planctomycetota bacterium]
MIALYATLAAGLGAIIGSFLNVVAHRIPRDEPLGLFRKTRSYCPSCKAGIRWFDNIPLVSYVLLLGKCRACGWRIPVRYPLVESCCAALFLLAVLRVDALGWTPAWLAFAVTAAFAAICLAATAIDFEHKILPDELTLRAGPVVAAAGALFIPAIHGTQLFGHDLVPTFKPGLASLIVGVAGAAAGAGIIGAIRWVGTLIARREAMGLGDVKFMAMCGLLLGPWGTVLAIMVAMVGGSVLGLLIWAVTRNREIPFGPFLAMGALAVLFYGPAIDHLIFVTYPAWVRGG